MWRFAFALLIAIHGAIHLIGFAKAFAFAPINQVTKEISKPIGVLWLTAATIFIASVTLYIFRKDYWWMLALGGVMLSQVLIILYWQDARFGTIANVFILLLIVIAAAEWRFENQYHKAVLENLADSIPVSTLTRESIASLPEPVQRYIIYSGAINKPVPKNFKIKFKGQIRKDAQSEWMPFTSEQFNFIDPPTRLFFMKASMNHLPVLGYHSYRNGIATMNIRLLSLFTVQYQAGREMDKAETVTWFNDLCLFAPGALIDKRIKWEAIDSLSAKATFTHQDITISAILYFNHTDELINFVSDDRYRIINEQDHQQIRFSTPAKNYLNVNEHVIPSYGEAVWNLPQGDLTYGQFYCQDIQYNVKALMN